MSSRYFLSTRLPAGAVEVLGLGKCYEEKIGWLRRLSHRFGDTDLEGEVPNGEAEDEPTSFETTWALKDITFSLAPGDRVAILGSAGAGKTTLMQVLAGHLAPTEGVVEGSGISVPLWAVVSPIIPTRTGYENLVMIAQLLRIPVERIDANIDKIAEFSGLPAHLHKEVRKYSKSMFPQFGLSMALNVQADILLVDDGVSARDPNFSTKATGRIAELIAQGTSLVLASGRDGQVRDWCTRGIILTAGRLTFDGGIEEACRRQFGS